MRKNDILLIVLILAAAVALLLFINTDRSTGGEISVAIGGEEVMCLSLDENQEIRLSSEQGLEAGQENILHIKDGKAFVSEANCPDLVCVERGEVYCEGETIICMPHKLVITVTEGEAKEIDGVSE